MQSLAVLHLRYINLANTAFKQLSAYPSMHFLHTQVTSPSWGNAETQRINNHAHTHPYLRAIHCGRKAEYPERTHACMGRTCKLHAERPQAGSRTQDLLAAR
ncbi:hypothetical protein ILYODFUR_001444 [Ilyodon furcidens]|uniref:Uncharacterized protein n=1 Tax=Ilyodon furcidens TaxID=33524 RepID=A0ABV0SHM1_9TELE